MFHEFVIYGLNKQFLSSEFLSSDCKRKDNIFYDRNLFELFPLKSLDSSIISLDKQ